MADAAAAVGSGGEKEEKEPPHRAENSSGGLSGGGRLSGEESRTAVLEPEDSTQNGGRCERMRSDEEPRLGAAAEAGTSPSHGHHRKIPVPAAREPLNDGLGASLPKAPEDLPPKKNFQIPRKSKEKKALQPIIAGSREFDDVVNILHSAYLDCLSKGNFTYKKAGLVHSELLEKEFIEKRRELKRDGRSEKELGESYAFLKVDRALVENICEDGLQVGHCKMTVLGNPSMGVYLSRYADLLQTNALKPGATGDVIIFKVIKGRMKSICDTLGVKPMDTTSQSTFDPTPKHECHVLKNANKINSLLNYRAYERSQYYFYEYGFDEIRQRPRHVCPYAVVSFSYKDEKVPKYVPQSRSKISNINRITDKASYTLWTGQLLNRGTLVCHVALQSETRPLLPCKLPEKLDVGMVMSIEHLTKKISPKVFYKEAYSGEKEEFRSGMYCSLYEVVERTGSGSNLEGLLQKLEKDKLVIVKPLVDRGYLLLLSPSQMASPYDNQAGRPRILQALFLFRNHRGVGISARKHDEKHSNCAVLQETHMVMPELKRFIQSLHYAFLHSRNDPKSDLNIAVEKHIHFYLKQYSKYKQFILYEYKPTLDDKKFLHAGPKNKSNLDSALHAYIYGTEAYQFPVSKAKKIMDGNRKVGQFSPVSDYEAPEEESDCSKRKARKSSGSKGEMVASQKKRCHSGDYDEESIQDLINLIQRKKKNIDRESDSEDNRSKSRKRMLESSTESPQKRLKTSSSSEKDCYDGEKASESLSSIIAGLGGRDTDLRQQNIADLPVPEAAVLKKIIGVLADYPLERALDRLLAENNARQPPEYSSIPVQIKEEPKLPDASHIENVQFKDSQSSVAVETAAPCLPYAVDVSTNEAGMDHTLHLKETSTGSVSSFDGCSSPCPSTPVEQNYHRQHSNSTNTGETAIHWKLIPITGGAGRVPVEQLREHGDNQTGLKSPEELLAYSPPKDASQYDPRVINRQKMSEYPVTHPEFSGTQKVIEDGVYTGQEEKLEQFEFATNHSSASKHCISGIIEKAVLDEYEHFTNKIQEILQQKNIMYVSGISKPDFSAKERIMKLSQCICLQASEISVQEYIEMLSEKLNKVALSSYGILNEPYSCSSGPANSLIADTALNLSSEEPLVPAAAANDFDLGVLPEPLNNNIVEDCSINESKASVILDTGKEQSPGSTTIETKLTADGNLSNAFLLQQSEKPQKRADNVNITTQPALADLISNIKPEVFDSIVKIMTDVRKNTVKFYIHEEQESTLCKEIKDYLIKLGNTECHPEQFLRRRANLDKLLIIIQNEDIASQIHKIPRLVTLKRLSCVSFAGVDSLDDVKNHTYNELFVSGGFIVSDETVLNPELITVDQLSNFLKFLEAMSTPDGKWQWKVHCKIQKKLKELGRINANANALLTLLNAYQKKHVVEILSYHNCDSQMRHAPELDCLINLQAQNLQQRHIVFLTEKKVQTFGTYIDNGIVVTTVDYFMRKFKSLVGYHNSVTEENSPPPPIDHERQSVFVENDEKDEEDMSLDSGDEASQIEVCNDVSKHDFHLEALRTETKGSHGADYKQNSQLGTQLSTEGHILVTDKTSKMDVQDIQPVTSVSATLSSEGEKTSSAEQVPLSNFPVYNRQLSVPHQFSHFNVLTHQTFLGVSYPMPTSRNQEGGNYFLAAYSQKMDMDQSSSASNWDVSCDSSRPYSKQT